MMMKREQKFRTVKETSEYLGIPLRTVYRLVTEGKIKSIRIGGTIRCLESDVEKCKRYGTGLDRAEAKVEEASSDRRAYERINTSLNSHYSVDLKPFRTVSGEGIIKDLSEGGLFLVYQGAEKELVAGDPVDLSFSLSMEGDKKVTVYIKGRVVRKDEKGVAVKFRFVAKKAKQQIKEYVG